MSRIIFIESNTTGTGEDFLRQARALEVEPLLLTRDIRRYPFARLEGFDFRTIDTEDADRIFRTCKEIQRSFPIVAVTSSSEYSVPIAAQVARALQLLGPDPQAVRRCRDKEYQRRALHRVGLPVPEWRVANTVEDARRAADELKSPVVCKPVLGSGSVGVRLVENAHAARQHAQTLFEDEATARGVIGPPRVLVEEFVDGPEFSVEVFHDRVVGITAKLLSEHPHFVELGHDFPAPLDLELSQELKQSALQAIRALGLTFGPVHVEMRVGKRGPVIIEVNPRLAGGLIPELVRLAAGVDLVRASVLLVCGDQRRLDFTARRHASIRFLMPVAEGKLTRIEGAEDARRVRRIDEVRIYRKYGDRISLRGDFRDRCGHVISVGNDSPRTRMAAEHALGAIQLRVSSPPAPRVTVGEDP